MHYVTNVIDYVTQLPLASRLSSSQTAEDVILALEERLGKPNAFGEPPGEMILVSDNGYQFAGNRIRKWIRDNEAGFRHMRDLPHHPQTIGMVERYHQSMKCEEVWFNQYGMPAGLCLTEKTDETRFLAVSCG